VVGVALFGSLIADQEDFSPGIHLAPYISAAAVFIGAATTLLMLRRTDDQG
jgi:hypothetical protein